MNTRKFITLPLGTRFRYIGHSETYVVLERHGFGLVARWTGVDSHIATQSICSASESEDATMSLMVEVIE